MACGRNHAYPAAQALPSTRHEIESVTRLVAEKKAKPDSLEAAQMAAVTIVAVVKASEGTEPAPNALPSQALPTQPTMGPGG